MKFIKQINENDFLLKDDANSNSTTPLLVPGTELLLYDHSYTNVRTMLVIFSTIMHHKNFTNGTLETEVSKHFEPVLDYLKPIAKFLSMIGKEFASIVAQTKASISESREQNDDVKLAVDAKTLIEALDQQLFAALKDSISLSLDEATIALNLLNEEGKSFCELINTLQEISKITSIYQLAGELFLVKMVQDFARKKNEDAIMSVLVETMHICDQYVKTSNDMKGQNSNSLVFKPEIWHAEAVYNLLFEITLLNKCQSLTVVESCVQFICSYCRYGRYNLLLSEAGHTFLQAIPL